MLHFPSTAEKLVVVIEAIFPWSLLQFTTYILQFTTWILQFTTATDEELVLGFATDPSIQFVSSTSSSKWSFIPTANTCGNTLHLPCPDHSVALPVEVELYKVHDMVFCNAYFGNC